MLRLVIAGAGLIGGSFALALRKAGIPLHICAINLGRNLDLALQRGAVDQVLPLAEACRDADYVYLALPIRRILDLLPALAAACPPSCLVTDAGSTKLEIVSRASALFPSGRFLGGHPMAGKETRGVAAAEADLFQGRPYLLTPEHPEDLDTPAAQTLLSWIRAIGAIPAVLSPAQHDATVALTSHLPQLLATALASLLDQHPERARLLTAAGPGLLDSTRLALSPFSVWADILATNRQAISEALEAHAAQIQDIRAALDDPAALERFFARAGSFAAALRE